MVNKCSIKFSIFFIILIMALTNVSAQAVKSITTVERGVDIIHPITPYVKLGEDLEINFWTYNSSDGSTMTNLTLNCTLYIINDKGVNFFRFSNQPGASGLITYGKGAPLCINCWTMVLGAGNLTNGLYSYQIKCQRAGLGGYETGMFEVTATGEESISTSSANFNLFLILALSSSIVLFLAFSIRSEYLAFVAGALFILTGLYSMIYGIADLSNLYTDSIGYIAIGLGAIFLIASGFSVANNSGLFNRLGVEDDD